MADPRLASISRVGTNPERRETFKIDNSDIVFDATLPRGSAVVDRAVTISGNGIVRLVGDNGRVDGQLFNVEADGACGVIREGVVLLPAGDGASVTAGSQIIGALGVGAARGYIKDAPLPGAAYAEATADAQAFAKHQILDASVATAVEVHLQS